MVLVRNIANETKREPLNIARINKIKESRDNVQRVVILTYHNISKNRNGKWIGTPMTVERSVNDLILVDDALNESMLSPKVKENEIETNFLILMIITALMGNILMMATHTCYLSCKKKIHTVVPTKPNVSRIPMIREHHLPVFREQAPAIMPNSQKTNIELKAAPMMKNWIGCEYKS